MRNFILGSCSLSAYPEIPKAIPFATLRVK
jgi:hypothetical protein